MEEKLITIGITSYNAQNTIGDAIESILNQTYDNIELLILNDKSNDNTVKIAKSYRKYFSSLCVIDYPRSGRAKCHNYAESIANTDILLFTDSETQFAKDFISNIVKPFIDPKVGISVGKLIFRDPYKSTTAKSFKVFWNFVAKIFERKNHVFRKSFIVFDELLIKINFFRIEKF